MNSEAEKKRKCRDCDSKRIICFRFAFAIFYGLVYVLSIWIIFFYLKSAGCLEDSPQHCFGKGIRKNLYSVGFSFDFYVFLSEWNEPNIHNETHLIWTMRNLTYNQADQPAFNFSTTVSISEVS